MKALLVGETQNNADAHCESEADAYDGKDHLGHEGRGTASSLARTVAADRGLLLGEDR